MRKRFLIPSLFALLVGVASLLGPAPSTAALHCDEACNDDDPAECAPDYTSFTVCIGGPGEFNPCENGSCKQ